MDSYHLTQADDKWKLKKEGADRASQVSDTKAEALKQMQKFMEDKKGSVKIHGQNGRIQEERTYQRKDDPRRSKG